jgi:cytochrome c553
MKVQGRAMQMVALLAIGTTLVADACAAQDSAAGRQLALQCQACHGLDGLAKIPGAPHIGGQPKEYLIKAMGDYKTGARKDDMMSVVMPQVSDKDIATLAAYYSSIEISVKAPQ